MMQHPGQIETIIIEITVYNGELTGGNVSVPEPEIFFEDFLSIFFP